MGDHWADRFFEPQQESNYDWPHGDNIHVRRLADAQRSLQEVLFADTAIDAERQALLAKAKAIRTTLAETQVSMVVAGSWNAGKSTLINAFLGERWMPMNVNRETVTVNRILDGERRQLRVSFRDGRPSWQFEEDYQNAQDVHKKIRELGTREHSAIERIDILYPGHNFLKFCAIIDTPGLDFAHEDSIVSQPLIDEADVLVWVMHVEGPREEDHRALRTFRQRSPDSRVLAVANYADMLDDGTYENELADKCVRLRDETDAVFLVSAKRDLEQKGSDPGFNTLRAFLNEQILPVYGDLRQQRPARLASEFVDQVHVFVEKARRAPLKGSHPYDLDHQFAQDHPFDIGLHAQGHVVEESVDWERNEVGEIIIKAHPYHPLSIVKIQPDKAQEFKTLGCPLICKFLIFIAAWALGIIMVLGFYMVPV